jgi:hypothetical protein
LIVDYAGASPIITMTNQIKTARGAGAWAGNGITSSLADATHYTLGIAEAFDVLGPNGGTFSGQSVDGTSVLVKYTSYGDADLNGIVNFDDYSLIDLAFNTQSDTLLRAMTYLDGSDRSDRAMTAPALRLVEAHFAQFGESYATSFLNAVPEPGAILVAGIWALTSTLSRRRRGRECRRDPRK